MTGSLFESTILLFSQFEQDPLFTRRWEDPRNHPHIPVHDFPVFHHFDPVMRTDVSHVWLGTFTSVSRNTRRPKGPSRRDWKRPGRRGVGSGKWFKSDTSSHDDAFPRPRLGVSSTDQLSDERSTGNLLGGLFQGTNTRGGETDLCVPEKSDTIGTNRKRDGPREGRIYDWRRGCRHGEDS